MGALAVVPAMSERVCDEAMRAREGFAAARGAAQTCPQLRVSCLLVEGGKLLVVRQVLRERAHWNLPGGKLELGELLEDCVRREMREETGLEVAVGPLLYVTDRFKALNHHVVDMSFAVRCVGGELAEGPRMDGEGECFAAVRMVPISELERYGFSSKFARLVARGFPERGSYQGEFHAFYG